MSLDLNLTCGYPEGVHEGPLSYEETLAMALNASGLSDARLNRFQYYFHMSLIYSTM